MALLAEAEPVFINTGIGDDFKITPEQLAAAITDKTRLFILNSPSNPTGASYSKGELQALGKVLEEYPQVVVASDEIYEAIHWGDSPVVSFAAACPALFDRMIVINGASKAYAMVAEYRVRHDYLVAALNDIDGFECRSGEGTFYAFPRVTGILERLGLASDIELTEHLLQAADVVVVPGSSFGAPGYLRLSFACSLESLKEAVKRIEKAVSA